MTKDIFNKNLDDYIAKRQRAQSTVYIKREKRVSVFRRFLNRLDMILYNFSLKLEQTFSKKPARSVRSGVFTQSPDLHNSPRVYSAHKASDSRAFVKRMANYEHETPYRKKSEQPVEPTDDVDMDAVNRTIRDGSIK